ncbi:MAG: hypothetical protein RQ990_07355 [Candidatus Hydrothermia bacterium]|nr:hypothetical protein [Candidatus Hydrothermia bacterium]
MIIYLALLLILSCQKYQKKDKVIVKSKNFCDSSFIDGVYYKKKFFILTLSCGIFEYDENFKKIKTYDLKGFFSISNESLFLASNKIYFYNDSFFDVFKEIEGAIGYVNGFYIFRNKVVFQNDTFDIPDVETFKFYKNKLIIGTNGYGTYLIENKKLKHFLIGILPSNFTKSISIYKDTIILGFSEPFSKSKIGFFYNNKILKVYEFSDDYIIDICSNNSIYIGTSNGLFKYENSEFHKIYDGYISKILVCSNDKLIFISNGKLVIKDL